MSGMLPTDTSNKHEASRSDEHAENVTQIATPEPQPRVINAMTRRPLSGAKSVMQLKQQFEQLSRGNSEQQKQRQSTPIKAAFVPVVPPINSNTVEDGQDVDATSRRSIEGAQKLPALSFDPNDDKGELLRPTVYTGSGEQPQISSSNTLRLTQSVVEANKRSSLIGTLYETTKTRARPSRILAGHDDGVNVIGFANIHPGEKSQSPADPSLKRVRFASKVEHMPSIQCNSGSDDSSASNREPTATDEYNPNTVWGDTVVEVHRKSSNLNVRDLSYLPALAYTPPNQTAQRTVQRDCNTSTDEGACTQEGAPQASGTHEPTCPQSPVSASSAPAGNATYKASFSVADSHHDIDLQAL
jgi:hypothetical protein